MSASPLAGASYLQAVLAEDEEVVACHRASFSDGELLEAVSMPVQLLARYIGYHTGKTPTEIGDALVRVALNKEKNPHEH